MKDTIALILAAKTPREFKQVMTQLNKLPVRELVDALTKAKTEKCGSVDCSYSLLYFINERMSAHQLKTAYPNIHAASEILHPQQKIELCKTIIAAMLKDDVTNAHLDKYYRRLALFVREGLHPDLVSCDSLINNDKSEKGCGQYALILFKMDFMASEESCILLAKKMICLTDAEDSTKVIDILNRIEKRYPDIIQRDELFKAADKERNVAAINWLSDKRAAKAQEKELQDVSFGKKKKKKKKRNENTAKELNATNEGKEAKAAEGIGHQLAALKDSPRNSTAEPGYELVNIAKEVLNDCSM